MKKTGTRKKRMNINTVTVQASFVPWDSLEPRSLFRVTTEGNKRVSKIFEFLQRLAMAVVRAGGHWSQG